MSKFSDVFKDVNYKSERECQHCWHAYEGVSMVVLNSGEIIQECCKCHEHRHVHRDHAFSGRS